jgi:hypothetical protein
MCIRDRSYGGNAVIMMADVAVPTSKLPDVP